MLVSRRLSRSAARCTEKRNTKISQDSPVLSDTLAGGHGGSASEVWKAWSSPPLSSLGGSSGGYSVVLPAIVLHLADILGQSFYPGELRALLQGKHYHTRRFPACQRAQCWHQQSCPRQPRWLQPTALAGQEPAAPPTPWEAHGEGGQCCNCGVAGRSAGRSCLTKTTSPKKSGHI